MFLFLIYKYYLESIASQNMSVSFDDSISFSVIPVERSEEVLDIFYNDFVPDEPISRSLGVYRSWVLDTFLKGRINILV